MQKTFDRLYQKSLSNRMNGMNLYKIITSENNIMLAYRTIKANTGSYTEGVDKKTISDYKIRSQMLFIREIRKDLQNFLPHPIKRVNIPKSNGEQRPLGIPTMRDRLIQQMFRQVLEPICEAKFYNHSYGFRPNRSAHHALARCNFLINQAKFHYVVDIDIKGFFDNVNHTKLIKQLYTIGIKDKRVLAIISKFLKAPVAGQGLTYKGTPQGGILSPLLSNVVLNDLDNWIASQWEKIKTRHDYASTSGKLGALKKSSKLKEMFIVRYADDFKIFTKNQESAWKIFHAVKKYLKAHLDLEISLEKSQITNLRKRGSEFLGFELKAKKKRNKYVANTHISKKNRKRIIERVKEHLKKLQKEPSWKNIAQYNSYILGIHNYYGVASHVNIDFSKIAYSLLYTYYNRLKSVGEYLIPRSPPPAYKKFYKNKMRTHKIGGHYLYPISDIQWRRGLCFTQSVCDYTDIGRMRKYSSLEIPILEEIGKLQMISTSNLNIEFTDNRLSKYSMQNGKCAIKGIFLMAEEVHCHHIIPKKLGGTDEFENLLIVHLWVHILIHAENQQTIEKYKRLLKLSDKQLNNLNKYREKCNLFTI